MLCEGFLLNAILHAVMSYFIEINFIQSSTSIRSSKFWNIFFSYCYVEVLIFQHRMHKLILIVIKFHQSQRKRLHVWGSFNLTESYATLWVYFCHARTCDLFFVRHTHTKISLDMRPHIFRVINLSLFISKKIFSQLNFAQFVYFFHTKNKSMRSHEIFSSASCKTLCLFSYDVALFSFKENETVLWW